jgi:uncharacterized protein YndB with AHSA1/START domain
MTEAVGAEPLTKEMKIDATPETVYAFFTEPELVTRWLAREVTMDPTPGGIFRQVHRDTAGVDHVMEGEFLVLEPPSRVVFAWAFEGMPEGDEISSVEVTLVPEGDGTLLRLVHHNLPESLREDHGTGWAKLLALLAVEAPGGR